MKHRVAVRVPCYNEEPTIADVVRGFRDARPAAQIYGYDNNSTDLTAQRAREVGTIVRTEMRQGKGNVVRRMFADIDADIYVPVDGDNTYHAPSARAMVQKLVGERLDMVVGSRLTASDDSAFRRGHRFGNRLLTGFGALLFGRSFTDYPFRGTGCSRGASSIPFRFLQRGSRPRRNLPCTLSSCACRSRRS